MPRKRMECKIEESIIQDWDKFRKEKLGGMNRTSFIINAVELYKLIMDQQLNTNQAKYDTMIKQIDSVVELFTKKVSLLDEEIEKNDTQIINSESSEIFNFDQIASKILDLLNNWGKLSIQMITENINVPSHLVYTVLIKLKAFKKVKVIKGEWEIYDRKQN